MGALQLLALPTRLTRLTLISATGRERWQDLGQKIIHCYEEEISNKAKQEIKRTSDGAKGEMLSSSRIERKEDKYQKL